MPSSSSTAIPTVSSDARIDTEGPRGVGIDAVDTGDALLPPLERVFPTREELVEFVR